MISEGISKWISELRNDDIAGTIVPICYYLYIEIVKKMISICKELNWKL